MKVVADAHIPYIQAYFSHFGELILKNGRDITRQDVQDADLLIVRSITHVNQNLLENTRVKFVGSITAGIDHLDTDYLDKAGISWCDAAGFNAPPVADYIICVLAALQRKRVLAQKNLRAAVIGVGRVGQLVKTRLELLGFNVTLCDPIRAENETNFLSTPLHELSELDVITLHVPLTFNTPHATHHFIEKNFLQRQKSNCVLINTSRGSVIHSADLLEYGKHLHWCLDVWENEPHINKTILEESMLASPHIAGYSVQSKMRGTERIYRAACSKKLIEPRTEVSLTMPQQQLKFAGKKHHWQDIVLGVFNPIIMTSIMRTKLLPAKEYGQLFDEMRNQFNYRHEFGFTKILAADIDNESKHVLMKLGMVS